MPVEVALEVVLVVVAVVVVGVELVVEVNAIDATLLVGCIGPILAHLVQSR